MKEVTKENFVFQELADGSISCVYYPKNRFAKKKSYLCVAQPKTRLFDFFCVCWNVDVKWYNLSYLAHIIEKYDNEIIPTI